MLRDRLCIRAGGGTGAVSRYEFTVPKKVQTPPHKTEFKPPYPGKPSSDDKEGRFAFSFRSGASGLPVANCRWQHLTHIRLQRLTQTRSTVPQGQYRTDSTFRLRNRCRVSRTVSSSMLASVVVGVQGEPKRCFCFMLLCFCFICRSSSVEWPADHLAGHIGCV